MLVFLTLILGVRFTRSGADVAGSGGANLVAALIFRFRGLTAGVWGRHFYFSVVLIWFWVAVNELGTGMIGIASFFSLLGDEGCYGNV